MALLRSILPAMAFQCYETGSVTLILALRETERERALMDQAICLEPLCIQELGCLLGRDILKITASSGVKTKNVSLRVESKF